MPQMTRYYEIAHAATRPGADLQGIARTYCIAQTTVEMYVKFYRAGKLKQYRTGRGVGKVHAAVIELFNAGQSNGAVAETLGMSRSAVRNHRHRWYNAGNPKRIIIRESKMQAREAQRIRLLADGCKAAEMFSHGSTALQVCAALGRSRMTVYRAVKAYEALRAAQDPLLDGYEELEPVAPDHSDLDEMLR